MQLIYIGMLLSVFAGWMLDDFVEYLSAAFCLSWYLGLVGVFGAIAKLLAWNLDRCSTSTDSRKSSRSQLMTFEWRSQAWQWIWAGLAACSLAMVGWGDFIESIIPKGNSAAMNHRWVVFSIDPLANLNRSCQISATIDARSPRVVECETWMAGLERRVKSLEKHYSIGKHVVVDSIERIQYVPL